MNQTSSPLIFKTIDLQHHADVSVEFRIDSFVASFGSPDKFYAEGGRIGWTSDQMKNIPKFT